MAIAVVQSTSEQFAAATQVDHFPATTADGNLLILFISMRTTTATVSSVVDDSASNPSWTQVTAGFLSGQNSRVEMWICQSDAGAGQGFITDITVNLSGSTAVSVAFYEISGAATSSPVDVSTANGSGSSDSSSDTSADGGSLTTTVAAGVLLHGISPVGTFQTDSTSVNSSYTLDETISGVGGPSRIGISSASRIVSSTGTYNPIFTLRSAAANSYAAAFIIEASGGTGYTSNVGGGITPSGALIKSTARALAGAITPVGALIKSTSRALGGALTPSGALIKSTARALAGAITPVGALIKSTSRALGGALTPSGALVKQTGKPLGGALTPSGALASVRTVLVALAGALTPSGALIKSTARALGGGLTPAGTLVKMTARALGGALTPSGSLAAIRTFLRSVGGALTPSGALVKQTGKALAGSIIPSGALIKSTARALAGALTPSGALAAIRAFLRDVGGALTPSGALIKSTARALGGALTPSGALARTLALVRALGGALTPSGALARASVYLKAVGGALTPSGGLAALVNVVDTNIIRPILRNIFKSAAENQTFASPREDRNFTARKNNEERD